MGLGWLRFPIPFPRVLGGNCAVSPPFLPPRPLHNQFIWCLTSIPLGPPPRNFNYVSAIFKSDGNYLYVAKIYNIMDAYYLCGTMSVLDGLQTSTLPWAAPLSITLPPMVLTGFGWNKIKSLSNMKTNYLPLYILLLFFSWTLAGKVKWFLVWNCSKSSQRLIMCCTNVGGMRASGLKCKSQIRMCGEICLSLACHDKHFQENHLGVCWL